jgi:fumarylpyruvate hydrolase
MIYSFTPPAVVGVPVVDSPALFPVHRIYCVGRNYEEHAKEMGGTGREAPFFFMKPADAVLYCAPDATAQMPYPTLTANLHHEIELVVAIGVGGHHIKAADAHRHIFGYAVGLDMTRRDLQLFARDKGRPWDLGKDVEQSSVCSEIVPMQGQIIDSGAIALEVNGQTKQSSDVNKLIWNVREIIADLSLFYHLQQGDLIYTGTPEGVGPVVSGDTITGRIAGVADISLKIGPAQ